MNAAERASERCRETEASLVAYLSGELRELEAERTRAHLQRCQECASLCEDMEAGLKAARAWRPDAPAAHLRDLDGRLQPYMQPHGYSSATLWVGALAALSLALALGVSVWALVSIEPGPPLAQTSAPPAPDLVSEVVPTPALAPASVAVVERSAPSPHLRMVTGGAWDGRVEGTDDALSVTMSRGFAAFAFEGGRGRRLRVSAPDALVEVVGTRFYVECENGATRVGVAEGKVRVLTLAGTRLLTTGETQTAGVDDGRPAVAAAYLDDPYLLAGAPAPEAPELARRRKRPTRRAAEAPGLESPPGPGPNVFAQLDAAEQLARAGEYRRAIQAYESIAADEALGRPYRDMARYESGRLWGFELDEAVRARSILRPLSHGGSGEVARQATLALCELDIEGRPCEAAACLRRLIEDSSDLQLASEATLLYEHWDLTTLKCGM